MTPNLKVYPHYRRGKAPTFRREDGRKYHPHFGDGVAAWGANVHHKRNVIQKAQIARERAAKGPDAMPWTPGDPEQAQRRTQRGATTETIVVDAVAYEGLAALKKATTLVMEVEPGMGKSGGPRMLVVPSGKVANNPAAARHAGKGPKAKGPKAALFGRRQPK